MGKKVLQLKRDFFQTKIPYLVVCMYAMKLEGMRGRDTDTMEGSFWDWMDLRFPLVLCEC